MTRPPSHPFARSGLTSGDMARVAVFAAFIGVLGLPGGFALFGNAVPVTLQTMGVLIAGAVLGARRGVLAVVTLLAVVAAGLPLLAGGRGGLGVFVGPSVGFIVGFVVAAAVVGRLMELAGPRPRLPWALMACFAGSTVVLLIGVPVQAVVTGLPLAETALLAAAFIPGDAVKAVVAAVIVSATQRAYPDAAPAARRQRVVHSHAE